MFDVVGLTHGVASFALNWLLANSQIRSVISSLLLAIIEHAPSPPFCSIRTRPSLNSAAPWDREDPPGHPFRTSFFLTARFKAPGPEPEPRPEFRVLARLSPSTALVIKIARYQRYYKTRGRLHDFLPLLTLFLQSAKIVLSVYNETPALV